MSMQITVSVAVAFAAVFCGVDRLAIAVLAAGMLMFYEPWMRHCVTAIVLFRLTSDPLPTDWLLFVMLASRQFLSFEMKAIFPAFLVPDWVSYCDWHANPSRFAVFFGVGIFLYGNILFQVATNFLRTQVDTVFYLTSYIVYTALCLWCASVLTNKA